MTAEGFLALRDVAMPAAEAESRWAGPRNTLADCIALHDRCEHGDCASKCSQQLPFPSLERDGTLIDRWNTCPRGLAMRTKHRAEVLLLRSGVPEAYQAKRLEGFEAELGTHAAFEAAKTRCELDRRGLLLAGPVGVGKTHLAVSIVNAHLRQNRSAVFALVPALIDDLRAAQRTDKELELRRLLERAALLVLDDLGKERLTPFAAEQLFKIIDARLAAKRQTIVTTNIADPDKLAERLGSDHGRAIVSRLAELCEWVALTGDDRRLLR